MSNGDIEGGWEDDWSDGYFDDDGIWREYGDFDIFEETEVDETDNYLWYNPISKKEKKPIWEMIGGKIYGLVIAWIVLSTKPWK